MSKNDITGDPLRSRVATDEFREGHERIFGGKDKESRKDALLRIYQTINSPAKAGPVWVTYGRKNVDALLDVVKQLLVLEGFMFADPEDLQK